VDDKVKRKVVEEMAEYKRSVEQQGSKNKENMTKSFKG